MHLYLNTNEKVKQNVRSPIHDDNSLGIVDDIQKRPIGYISILSLSSTIPTENMTIARPKFALSTKQHQHSTIDFGKQNKITFCFFFLFFFFFFFYFKFCFVVLLDKPFNDDDEYIEEEEINSELEDSDVEINLKAKQQKFNPNIIRDKIIQMFKKKANQTVNNQNRNSTQTTTTTTNPTGLSYQHDRFTFDRPSEIEEDLISDLSDSTIPVDQWSIESVPKPGFTPVEYLQVLKSVSEIKKKKKKKGKKKQMILMHLLLVRR